MARSFAEKRLTLLAEQKVETTVVAPLRDVKRNTAEVDTRAARHFIRLTEIEPGSSFESQPIGHPHGRREFVFTVTPRARALQRILDRFQQVASSAPPLLCFVL